MQRKKHFLVLLIWALSLGFALTVNAQDEIRWEFAGWYGGGCYPNIEFDPNHQGRVYLTSDVAGIWRSDDKGESWRFSNKGLENLYIPALTVAPSDSNVLYAAAKAGLFVSRDAGATWVPAKNPNDQLEFLRPQSYKPLAVSLQDPKKICVGTVKGKVFCSENSGQKWVDIDPKGKILGRSNSISVVLYTSDGKGLWIGSKGGLFSYSFATKAVKVYPEAYGNITDMVLSWDNKTVYGLFNGILRVFDNGLEVKYATYGKPQGSLFRIALKMDESDKDRFSVLAAVNQGWKGWILSSEDKGVSWKNIVEVTEPDISADPTWAWANPRGKSTSLKIDPFDQNVVFMTNWWGVFRSDDGGKTWKEKIRGAPNTVGSDIQVNGDTLWVATMDNGLLKSGDGGQTYSAVFPSDRYDSAKAGHVWRVILPDADTVVATSSPWDERLNQVIVSKDGGKTFKIVRKGLPKTRSILNTVWGQGYPRAIAFDPLDPLRIYLGIDGDDSGGLFVSSDGGLSWGRSVGQPASLRIYNGLAVDPTDPKRIFWGSTGKGGGVYVSPDQGLTWKYSLKDIEWVFDLAVTPSGKIFAAGSAGAPAVFRSDSNGEFWEKKTFGDAGAAEALAVDPHDEKRVAVSTVLWGGGASGKIFLSKDGGKEWEDITGDLPPGAGAAAMAFSPGGEYLYISRYAGSAYRLKLN